MKHSFFSSNSIWIFFNSLIIFIYFIKAKNQSIEHLVTFTRAVVDTLSRQCGDNRQFCDCRHTILLTPLSRQSRLLRCDSRQPIASCDNSSNIYTYRSMSNACKSFVSMAVSDVKTITSWSAGS